MAASDTDNASGQVGCGVVGGGGGGGQQRRERGEKGRAGAGGLRRTGTCKNFYLLQKHYCTKCMILPKKLSDNFLLIAKTKKNKPKNSKDAATHNATNCTNGTVY